MATTSIRLHQSTPSSATIVEPEAAIAMSNSVILPEMMPATHAYLMCFNAASCVSSCICVNYNSRLKPLMNPQIMQNWLT